MCGITGWVSFQRDLSTANNSIDAMTATMACRGPDGSGTWVAPHVALGHRRLAIIDLAGGAQPMTIETPDGVVAMVYSGEAYNFRELREELHARGQRCATASDTEVVLRAYLEWGTAFAERLNGMYAFAIWDARIERLVLVRDRLGIKPFYYYPTEDGLLFGSEPKAILANPLADRSIGLDGLRELFVVSVRPEGSAWTGMRQVPPGSVVTVDRDGVRTTTYWTLRTLEHGDDRASTVRTIRELLEDVVARQLISDVPRCMLLSGGLDSSALTTLAAAHLRSTGEQVRSFSVEFQQQDEDFVPDEWRATLDAPFARALAEHAGTRHRDIRLDSAALADPAVRAAVVTARDVPTGHGDTDASLYLLFKAIREHSTVALSGESADEVFAGYRWFRTAAEHGLTTFPWLAVLPPEFVQRTRLLDPDLTAALDLDTYLADSFADAVAEVARLDGESDLEFRMRRVSHLHITRLLRTLLDRKDRMSMAVGLEVRVPYCDHRLVEYVYNAPWSLKTFDGREKSLLRAATADTLPRSVVERVKSHYPITKNLDYVTALLHQSADLLTTPDHPVFRLYDHDAVTKAVDRPAAHLTEPDRFDLEQLLDFAIWLDHYNPHFT
ncbi:asparagine synthetase [Nocardia brasiliensis NBRC 14402]|uniref:asparagine synthase (glutamine-hydrolyzing) n=1 Tax=Nocardia brasiliensis TaxID=37326 RepID=UPI0002EC4B69|nr:asparagine synthase (glutamine-hydrolyzing) [Nocardia brasiliensis]AVL26504.1 asparagine synthase (glutamine-hydrolyzing) [Nocardia brasiliensis]GAJ82553.1 asparagine synthetase [Nocardia brasiliensis NBRC 14402]SUB09744.1 Asparagine synthetase [glutamine-hydrolyzing] 3 [Nocardia brasiliensis]